MTGKLAFSWFLLFASITINSISRISSMNVILKSFENCHNDAKYPIFVKLTNIKHVGNYVHRFNVNASVGINVDNTKYQVNIFKNKRKLPVNFSGRDACKALGSLLGEVYHDVAKAIKLDPTCPIKKGNYIGKNVEADLKKIKIMLPVKGEFRVAILAEDIPSNSAAACVEIIADLK